MGIGVITFTPIGFLFQLWVQGDFSPTASSEDYSPWPDFQFTKAAPWGISAGLVYGGATILQISAIDALDYATAYTITQANLVVTGLLGILLFDELKGFAKYVFFSATFLVIGGAALVSIYGTTRAE